MARSCARLVDEQQRWLAGECGIPACARGVDLASRQDLEPGGESLRRILAAVRLDDADHDIAALLALAPRFGSIA
jgi:hypothetical protein